jgi:hypothetical protein
MCYIISYHLLPEFGQKWRFVMPSENFTFGRFFWNTLYVWFFFYKNNKSCSEEPVKCCSISPIARVGACIGCLTSTLPDKESQLPTKQAE